MSSTNGRKKAAKLKTTVGDAHKLLEQAVRLLENHGENVSGVGIGVREGELKAIVTVASEEGRDEHLSRAVRGVLGLPVVFEVNSRMSANSSQ